MLTKVMIRKLSLNIENKETKSSSKRDLKLNQQQNNLQSFRYKIILGMEEACIKNQLNDNHPTPKILNMGKCILKQ